MRIEIIAVLESVNQEFILISITVSFVIVSYKISWLEIRLAILWLKEVIFFDRKRDMRGKIAVFALIGI